MSARYDNAHFFEPIKQILNRVLAAGPLARKRDSALVWSVWDEVVGPKVAAHARPLRLQNGVLTVAVDSPAWHHQLEALQQHILHELQSRVGARAIKRLRFRA